MKLTETFKISVTALNANKIRTSLTMLGVIIGVSAVVLLISLGRGIQNYITDQFEALGSNLIFVSPGRVSFNRDPSESFSRNKLEEKHIRLIQTQAPNSFEYISPVISVGETVKYKTNNYFASVNALNEDGDKIFNYEVDKGRFFTKSEVRAKAKVVLIGKEVQKELFPNRDPIGQKVKIGKNYYEVIGTYKEKGRNFDEQVVIPYTSAKESFGLSNISNIAMKAGNTDNIDKNMRQIEKALLRDLEEDDFTVLSQKDVLNSIQNILQILTLGLGAIAGISLLVGGIGIMNIMLVSVTERTREIGLRKAVGATPVDIANQFLFESTLLSVGGGIIGIILGWLGSLVARNFLRTEVPWWSVLLAFSFAAIVGIIFGTYPAVKASKKDPIEALRYE